VECPPETIEVCDTSGTFTLFYPRHRRLLFLRKMRSNIPTVVEEAKHLNDFTADPVGDKMAGIFDRDSIHSGVLLAVAQVVEPHAMSIARML
jgi:hypothetical protein